MRKVNMRQVLASLVALGLLASGSANAQSRCSSATDQAAFDVGALKSELSILAVGCHDEDDYNRFIERYRGELVSQDAVVNAWFKRVHGRSAQTSYDSYITLLANEQSNLGQRQGTDFCPRLKALFSEVMALPQATLLPQYAAVKDIVPAEVGSCGGQTQAAAAPTRETRRTTTTRRSR